MRRFCNYLRRYKKHYIKSLHAKREGAQPDTDKRWENFKKFQEHLLGVAKQRYGTYRAEVQEIVEVSAPLTGSAVTPKPKLAGDAGSWKAATALGIEGTGSL